MITESTFTRNLSDNWGGGGLFIYSCYARRISFVINSNSKEIRWAEHEYMNKHPPPPTISVLVTSLHGYTHINNKINKCKYSRTVSRISTNCGNALKLRIAFTPTNVYDHTYICKEIYMQVIPIMSAVLWR